MPATLTITGGPSAGGEIEVSGELVIGRHAADVTIDDAELSRRHAVLRPDEGAVEIEDLGSLNGTFVNETRISQPTRLAAGDVVRVGQTTLELVLAEAPAGATRLSPRPQETIEQRAAAAPSPGPQPLPAPPSPAEAAPAPPPPPAAPAPAPAPAAAQPASLPEFGRLTDAPPRRRGRAATRAVTPALFTFAAVVGTAAALIAYFAQRG